MEDNLGVIMLLILISYPSNDIAGFLGKEHWLLKMESIFYT